MRRRELPIHGRDDASAQAKQLLVEPGFRAVLIRGHAGIGKSTIFEHLVSDAEVGGRRLLVARPTEAEKDLPYVSLGDLFADCGDAIDELPPTLREAIDRALLRAGADGAVERHAVGRATASVLDVLAADKPLLLAVDDVHWIDAASAGALSFALRRHQDPGSKALLTERSGVDGPLVLDGVDAPTITLGPLPAEALDRLVLDHLGITLSKPRLAELHRLSQGNPLHAIEIARADAASPSADGKFRVPGSLSATLEQRLRALTPPGFEATLIAALSGDVTERTIRAVVSDRAGLDEAVRQGTLEVTAAERVRCSHPLIAPVAIGMATPWEVRRLHLALADVVGDEMRLHHLALGADEPDEALATELETAAAAQAARAAPEAATVLARASARLSIDATARRRRMFYEAHYLLAGGEVPPAQALLEELVDQSTDPIEKARTLLLLADTVGDEMERSIELGERALALAEGDPALLAECHAVLEVLTWINGDVATSAAHLRAAVPLAEAGGNETRLASVLAELCHLDVLLECRYDPALMERASEIEGRLDLEVTERPSFLKGMLATMLDDPVTARPLLERSLVDARAVGDESILARVLFRSAELELRTGNWGDALRFAREFLEIESKQRALHEEGVALCCVATVAAHAGLVDEARQRGEAGIESGVRIGDRITEVRSRGALGLLELSLGHVREARALLEPAQAVLDQMGIGELSIHHVASNLIEVRVLDGDLDGACALIERVRSVGEPAGRTWHRVIALRGDAMVAAARGDLDGAFALAQQAVDAAQELPQPFEQARTLLMFGDIARRARRRAEARTALTAALERFDELGAPLWADRAAANLARIGGRAPSVDSGLTAMERSVAELVAQGRTNREIAAELFVAVRTVESNLTRIYAKLGVRGRAELVAQLSTG